MGKLTKRTIEALAPREIDYIAWDNDVPGFGVRVMPSGRKSFVLQYRAGRRSRRMVLGYVNVVTPEQARTMAIQHLAALRQGVDPLAERDAGRDAVTVKDLAARFDAEHIAVHLKPSTQKEYRRSLKKFILPFFGSRPIAEVSREEVARFHHKYRHVPYQANRCLEILSKMFNLAELWGLRPDGSNPRKHIKKYREEKRERFLSRRRAAARRRGARRDGSRRAGDAVGDRGGAAAHPHRLPAERDHDAEVGVRRSRRRHAESPGLQDRRQGRAHRQAGGRMSCAASLPCPAIPGSSPARTPAPAFPICSRSGSGCAPAPASRTPASTTCATPSPRPPSPPARGCR